MIRSRLLAGAAMFAAAASLAACTSTPRSNASLDLATATYQSAANNPVVVEKAPLELQRAQQTLAQAQSEWSNGAAPAQVDHTSYLAMRRAQIAQETAQLKTSQDIVAHADAERAQTLLAARTVQAEQANIQAQQANMQAQQAETRAAMLQEQTEQLQQQLNARQTDRGMVLTLGTDILFDTGLSTLKPGAYPTIQKVASFLQQSPERTVIIQGFTDSTGTAAFNQSLSQQRADAVRVALANDGVSPSRVESQGMGESSPVASNATDGGRQLNRRVELVISNPATPNTLSGASQ